MKCLYYLTSTLDSTQKITDDLHQAGIDDWFIHIVAKDGTGLSKEKFHSSYLLEQLDLLRYGIILAIVGFLIGLIAVVLINLTEPFGSDIPNNAYYAMIIFFTLFGAWEGGFIGSATENKKIALFHDDLESGSYLILIYAKKIYEDQVKKVMERRHPEAKLAAVDAKFYNPLSDLKRI